jgi:hypothetical protein
VTAATFTRIVERRRSLPLTDFGHLPADVFDHADFFRFPAEPLLRQRAGCGAVDSGEHRGDAEMLGSFVLRDRRYRQEVR